MRFMFYVEISSSMTSDRMNSARFGENFLWPPCVADADIIFLPCDFFLSSIFFYSSPNVSGCKFQRVSLLGSVTAQPNCGVEHRTPPVFGRAAITLGIGPHF